MDVTMLEFLIRLTDTSINQEKGRHFIPMNLWTDTMTVSMCVLLVQIILIVITPTTSSMKIYLAVISAEMEMSL